MLRKLMVLIMGLIMFISYVGVAAAQDKIAVSILVESKYAPTGAYMATFINSNWGTSWDNIPHFTKDPIIENDRMLVPLRQIAEALGYSVAWEPNTQEIELNGKNINGEDTAIIMNIGVSQATVNSRVISLDVAPKIINDYTMIPLRFISESMGYYVKYISMPSWIDINITDYPLLENSEIDNILNDKINYYENKNMLMCLKSSGQTERGIRLGDSIEKVLQSYPRGISYPANFTGCLSYVDQIEFQRGGTVLLFDFNNGILENVTLSH